MRTFIDYLIGLFIIVIGTLLGGPIGFILATILVVYLSKAKKVRPKAIYNTPPTHKVEPEEEFDPEVIWDEYYSRVPYIYLDDYRTYLKTQEWRDLRKKVFDRDSHRCVRCGYIGDKKQCHHTNYRNIETMDFSIDQLETVCYGDGVGCHERIHKGLLPMKKDT